MEIFIFMTFLSTLSLRRATASHPAAAAALMHFYPRSPCGERPAAMGYYAAVSQISIHALLAESDLPLCTSYNAVSTFLSTLSLRRATQRRLCRRCLTLYFYPRSPCGERRHDFFSCCFNIIISIHALLAESDPRATDPRRAIDIFLSTLSLRRATRAPCAASPCSGYFYPRSPCGERPCRHGIVFDGPSISIHALLAESDPPKLLPSSSTS